MSTFETFSQLHRNSTPLLLGNIWDVNSARIFEANGYSAIGTSSQAVAKSLGQEDGEKIPFEILLQLAKRVVEMVRIPLSVDMEGGYSRTIEGIIGNIDQLHNVGVAGINLEDTLPADSRQLQSVAGFQKTLSAIAGHISRNNYKMFLNIRTDAFLLGMPAPAALSETLTRIDGYKNSGADGIFVPCITDRNDIKQVVKATLLPINVMCMPGLPDFEELGSLGVKRVSMGPFFFNKACANIGELAKTVRNDRNFSSIL
jgi:2-methylisocitrate lyase-like PEP mutase family enzyme